jgi:hypothetical protein
MYLKSDGRNIHLTEGTLAGLGWPITQGGSFAQPVPAPSDPFAALAAQAQAQPAPSSPSPWGALAAQANRNPMAALAPVPAPAPSGGGSNVFGRLTQIGQQAMKQIGTVVGGGGAMAPAYAAPRQSAMSRMMPLLLIGGAGLVAYMAIRKRKKG